MKNILIINGNPNKESLNAAMAWKYFEGANQSTEKAELIHISDLDFDPNMPKGYSEKPELEPDLKMMQKKIQQADHLVWVFPNWWGGVPAMMKGFIDRTLLPGFAFKYREKSPFPAKLLKGKTASLIITMDTPPWVYKLFYGAPVYNMMKKRVLKFVGFSKIRVTAFGPVRNSKEERRKKWLKQIRKLGLEMK